MDDCLRNLTIRKDQGYVSEVNSCDSGHEAVSLPDEIVPVSEISILNEKDSDELKLELAKIKQALQEKVVECEKLSIVREKVESELEDLTTSLFEEANKMVYEANFKQDRAEKKLAVAEGKIEALETEISALKSLVITSTPSNPNPKSHPQLIRKNEGSPIRSKAFKQNISELFKGIETSDVQQFRVEKVNSTSSSCTFLASSKEIDPVFFDQLKIYHKELLQESISFNHKSTTFCACPQSHSSPSAPLHQCEMISKSTFLSRVLRESISPCLDFADRELSVKVSSCIHNNSLSVELSIGQTATSNQFCCLSHTSCPCKHRIRFSEHDPWHSISQSCRNRSPESGAVFHDEVVDHMFTSTLAKPSLRSYWITSVCNFLTYLRYIRQGIVNHDVEQIYWEVNNYLLEISFATLGYYKSQV